MRVQEAFDYVKNSSPQFIYVSGKTSTGKSTFANKLRDELGYQVVNLDKIVSDAVIKKWNLPEADTGQVFREIYKHRERREWLAVFIAATQSIVQHYADENQPVIIDGAVANILTLQELLAAFPATLILYFHPEHLETYQKYLLQRFMQTNSGHQAGLPKTFWDLVDKDAFGQFCQDRIVTASLQDSIAEYARVSQHNSVKRLQELRNNFTEVSVVKI